MNLIELARWQWAGYPQYHQSRVNLAVHLVAVPLFWLGLGLILGAAWWASWLAFGAGLVLLPASIALQGFGHKFEPIPAVPFSSPSDAVSRLLLEQLLSFPRFVLSLRAFRP